MTIIGKHQLILTRQDDQTNVIIPFSLDKTYKKLLISFSYEPSHATREESEPLVLNAIERYQIYDGQYDPENIDGFFPIENLVTLSITKNGEFIGARHSKDRFGTIELSKDSASLGYLKTAIEAGHWEVQLNVHCIASKNIEVHLKLEVFE